jgi:hypothetical protein
MGGSVAVTLRMPDGTEHRMARSTFPMSGFVNNMRFVRKEQAWIDAWMSQWYNMVADWDSRKEIIDQAKWRFGDNWASHVHFSNDMTPVHAVWRLLAPYKSGIIVLDMRDNLVMSCQSQVPFGKISISRVKSGLDRDGEVIKGADEWNQARTLEEFHKEGKVKGVFSWSAMDFSVSLTKIGDMSFYDLLAYASMRPDVMDRTNLDPISYAIDLSPFKVVEFKDNDVTEAEKFRNMLLQHGFVLSKEEEQAWDNWINDREDT